MMFVTKQLYFTGVKEVGQCCRECNKLISKMVAVTAVLATSVTTMLMQ